MNEKMLDHTDLNRILNIKKNLAFGDKLVCMFGYDNPRDSGETILELIYTEIVTISTKDSTTQKMYLSLDRESSNGERLRISFDELFNETGGLIAQSEDDLLELFLEKEQIKSVKKFQSIFREKERDRKELDKEFHFA